MLLQDRVNILLKLASEGFALSRHYEQMQYAIMAALIAGIGAVLSNRSVAQENGWISKTYIPFLAVVFFVLGVLQIRFLSLSIMQFHRAQTQVNLATGMMTGNQLPSAVYPFDIDMSSRSSTKIPQFVEWVVTATARPHVLYVLPTV